MVDMHSELITLFSLIARFKFEARFDKNLPMLPRRSVCDIAESGIKGATPGTGVIPPAGDQCRCA